MDNNKYNKVQCGALANVAPNVKRALLIGALAFVAIANTSCQRIDGLREEAADKITCGQYTDTGNPYNLPGVQGGAGEETGCDALRDMVRGQ